MGYQITLNEQELKKHVAVIHCANTISLLQRKISNALLSFAYPNLMTIEEHTVSIKQLCNLIGYSGNNHQVIKNSLKSLISTVLEWNVIDSITGEEDWTASTMLASANIKGAKCKYAYSPRMRDLLYSPSMYGKINLAIQTRFKSSYGLALYENCVRYKGLPYTRWFTTDVFRKLMGVTPGTYSIFRDLKKRILDKAVLEVNTYSDFCIEYEIEKELRKVTAIRFKLNQKEKKKVFFIDPGLVSGGGEKDVLDTTKDILVQQLRNFGLQTSQINSILQENTTEYVQDKITYLESTKSFQSGKIIDVASYLRSALQKDYQTSKTSKEIIYEINKKNENEKDIKRMTQKKEEELKFKYIRYIEQETDTVIDKLSPNKIGELKKAFKNYLLGRNDKFILPRYDKEGLDNKIIRACFKNFIKENYPSLLPPLISFDEFSRMFHS